MSLRSTREQSLNVMMDALFFARGVRRAMMFRVMMLRAVMLVVMTNVIAVRRRGVRRRVMRVAAEKRRHSRAPGCWLRCMILIVRVVLRRMTTEETA